MPSTLRAALVAALATGCHCAFAQTAVPPAVTVQQIAPQLVTFAGSLSNFENLVAGLAEGSRVQLMSFLADGSAQVASFTPAAVPVEQIAPALEAARQRLISLGIAAPTAEQLALSITGGTIPTALGGAKIAGVVPATGSSSVQNPPSLATQIQVQNVPAANAATTTGGATTSTAVAAPRLNTSDSPIPSGATSFSPTTPVATLSAPGPGSTPLVVKNPTPSASPANRLLRR
jgi:hypothetical protein